MSYPKLPAIPGRCACLTCGCGSHDTLALDSVLAVGFGSCNVMKDHECVYDENQVEGDESKFWTCQNAEDAAKADPDHDWRICFYAPLYDAEYQRQGDGHWVLVKSGEGFA
jgi:hypothetical protein